MGGTRRCAALPLSVDAACTSLCLIVLHAQDEDADEAVPFKDAFVLDTRLWEWTPVHMPAAATVTRTGHSMCVANVGDLGLGVVSFGGVDANGDKVAELGFLPLTTPPSL